MHTRCLLCLFLFLSLNTLANRIQSKASGNFNEDGTWLGGVSPNAGDTAVIRGGDVVSLSFQNATVRALYVEPSGELVMQTSNLLVADTIQNRGAIFAYSASSVVVGGLENKGVDNRGYLRIGYGTNFVVGDETQCNRLFTSTGELLFNPNSISRIYGRTRVTAGILTQDGGQIFFYGNSGQAATSVAVTDNIVFMNATAFNCTAGSMTIVDAHHESLFAMVNTVEITGNNAQAFTGTHVWYIGDAISTKPAHLNRGITLGNGQKNGPKAPVNHLWVQTRYIGQRFFYTSITPNSGTYMNGDFKVVFQSEAKHVWINGVEMAIGGDLEVDDGSIFTNSQPIILGAGNGYTIAKKQVVYSSGTIREDVFNPAFQFGALMFNNSLAGDTAVRFTAGSTIKVRDSISFLAGVAAMQSLQLGNSNHAAQCRVVNGGVFSSLPNSPISITRYYKNDMGNTVAFGSGYDTYPFASATDFTKRTLQVQVQQVGSGGNMQAIFYDGIGSVPATPIIHGTDNGVFCNTLSRQYWYLQAENGLAGTGVQVRCTGGNMLLDGNAANIRLHKSGGIITGTSTGGGTALQPMATKTNLPDLMAAGGTYYFAGNSSLLVTKIPSVASGAFGQTTTWKFNHVPDEYYGAIIKPGHQVQDATPGIRQLLSMEVENTGKLTLAKTGGILAVINKTTLNGNLEIAANTQVRLSKWGNDDASLLIAGSGELLVNHPQAKVELLHQFSLDNKLGSLVNYGSLTINEGSMYCLGYLHLLGNSKFTLGNGASLYFLPNGTQEATPQTVFYVATSGRVEGNRGTIYFTDPPRHTDQHTLLIERSQAANFNLAGSRIVLGYAIPSYPAGTYSGAAHTGFKLETQGGSLNVPLGKIVVSTPGAAANRFVRNGNKSLFITDSVKIENNAVLHYYPSSGENIIGGVVENSGLMISAGKIILGGTAQYPGKEYVQMLGVDGPANFANAASSPTAGFNELEIRHSGQSASINCVVTIANKLQLTRGFFYPKENFTLGTGTHNTGELEVTGGRLLSSGKIFWRWFSTATVPMGSTNGLYPFTRPDGLDKWVYISGTPLAGGRLGLYHAAGNLTSSELAPRTEAGVDITMGFAGEWQGYTADGFINNNMGLRVISEGTRVSPVANARLLNGGYLLMSSGTHVSSTGTPDRIVIDRVGVTAQTLFESFRIAAPAENIYNIIKSVKNGKWTEPSTWDCNCVPIASSTVTIEANHKVTLEANSGNRLAAHTITVNNGATLDIKGDTLTAFQVRTTSGAELKISGGILQQHFPGYIEQNENAGNYLLTAGQYNLGIPTPDILPGNHWFSFNFSPTSVFTQSGGMFRSQFPVNFHSDCKVNITGGSIYLLTHSPNASKPHTVQTSSLKITGSANGGATKLISGYTIIIPNPLPGNNKFAVDVAGQNISFANSTVMLGDTTLNEDMQTGNANGFNILSAVKLPHIIAAGGNSVDGRHTTYDAVSNLYFGCDNLYITPNSEWRNPNPSNPGFKVFIHGNLVNEGNYTNYLATTVLGGGYNGSVANSPQYLSGSGRFRFQPGPATPMEPMINFFEVNNLSSEGVTLKRNLKVSQLNMINGDIQVDTLQVGTADWDWGAIIPSGTGAIVGHVTKWIRNIPDQFNIPVGVKGMRRNLKMIITQAPVPSGLVTFSFASMPGGSLGLPLQEVSINLLSTAPEGFWRIGNHGVGFTWYSVEATAAAIGNVTDYTKLVLLKRVNESSPWTLEGAHSMATGNNSLPVLYRNNLNNFSDFGIGLNAVPFIPANSLWTGNVSNEWFNAGNWNNGVPGTQSTATIPGSRPRYPIVTNPVNVKTLKVQNGGSLQVGPGINFNINGSGSL